MAHHPSLETMLRHDRGVVIFILLIAIVLAWTYLLSGAGTMQEMDGMMMPMSSGEWTPSYAALMLAMWVVMMMAMMLPSAAPMILLYATIARNRLARGERVAPAAVFALGYVAVWAFFSLGAVLLQFALETMDLLSSMMKMTSARGAAIVLIAAGAYQLTAVKRACLQRCRSPLDFVVSHWREGTWGAFEMGMRHGIYCAGCCWMLMLLLFVGGIMNLAWIGGLAAFVLVEKLLPAGMLVSRIAGLLLILWGAGMLVLSG